MAGLDGMKQTFFSMMKQIANSETKNNTIDTDKEVTSAKKYHSELQAQLSNMSDPIIGDTTDFSNTKTTGEVTVQDMLALLNDSELNIDRVNQLIVEKPVSEDVLAGVTNAPKAEETPELDEMINKTGSEEVKYYTNVAKMTGDDLRTNNTMESFDEISQVFASTNDNGKFLDAFMGAIYGSFPA